MKSFLMTTTFLAGIALGGAAFAQTSPVLDANGNPLYTWTDSTGALKQGTYTEFTAGATGLTGAALTAYNNSLTQLSSGGPYEPTSLLDNLLADATALQASLTNVAENLNDVNGSINVATSRSLTDMASVIDSLSVGGTIPFGSFSQVGANVFGQDLPASLLAVLNPTVASLGDLSTTAIGAMQSGSITATIDADGLVDKASSTATASTTSAMVAAETYGNIANTVAFQNIANNAGYIDGSVNLALADVNATVGKVATTAIGAMGSGSLTATISGNMGSVTRSSANIINALVGAP